MRNVLLSAVQWCLPSRAPVEPPVNIHRMPHRLPCLSAGIWGYGHVASKYSTIAMMVVVVTATRCSGPGARCREGKSWYHVIDLLGCGSWKSFNCTTCPYGSGGLPIARKVLWHDDVFGCGVIIDINSVIEWGLSNLYTSTSTFQRAQREKL